MRSTLLFLALGTAFGVVLSRSGAADYDVVQGMFLLTSFQLWGIMGAALAVLMPGLALLKRSGRAASGAPLRVAPKPRHPGNVAGGVLFGAGWAITGMCPGPIFVNVGEGKLYALGALAGALAGAALFGLLYERWPAWLRLPALSVGTGDG
jgi:uncharacterized membrane protein YedE/YeeE